MTYLKGLTVVNFFNIALIVIQMYTNAFAKVAGGGGETFSPATFYALKVSNFAVKKKQTHRRNS